MRLSNDPATVSGISQANAHGASAGQSLGERAGVGKGFPWAWVAHLRRRDELGLRSLGRK